MHSAPPLLFTLVLGLSAALLFGWAARAMRLPPIIGYLAAGILAGPHTPGPMADPELIAALAEIGVALLLFQAGLHVSVEDLLASRRVVLPGALAQVALGTLLGAMVGHLALGLGATGALVFGLALAIASTAVATRVLEDHGRLNGDAGRLALGWLMVQDVVVVVALVLLPQPEQPQGTLWEQLASAIGLMLAFAMLMALVGRRLLPWLLAKIARTGSRDLFTTAVLVAGLGVAWGASELFGISVALGAFLAGVVLGESDLSHQAAARALPLQHVFAVLFFVSAGMLVDPMVLVAMPWASLAAMLAAMLGTGVLAAAIMLLLRVPPGTACTAGAAMAQIGEFSVLLIGLAVGRKLLPEAARDLVLAATFGAIMLSPLSFRLARLAMPWLEAQAWLARWRDGGGMPPQLDGDAPSGHAVLIGHGRVGSVVADGLRRHGLRVVAVEADRKRAERLRGSGAEVIWGDATEEQVLAAANPQAAKLAVIALPDAVQARQVLEALRAQQPDLPVAMRVHDDAEMSLLADAPGVDLVVMGEREVALAASDWALRRFGISAAEAQATVDRLRVELPGGSGRAAV